MTRTRVLNAMALTLVVLALGAIGLRNTRAHTPVSLLNASYDPTRELYAQLNPAFVASFEQSAHERISIRQAHGGSSRQARSVISGELEADVVTLGLPSDVQLLQKHGLIEASWASRLPNESHPYYSTIVFVVRTGNPRAIHDWPDLIQPGVEIITPDPRTSGNGKLSALAAWGAIIKRGGSDAEARAYLKAFYEHTPFLDSGARSAAIAFAIEKVGDVHLAWENEALREVAEAKGALEIVYPPLSILAEPSVAWVDANVARHHTQVAARAYLEFLFSDAAQEVIAESGYRPQDLGVLARHGARFPKLNLFSIKDIAKDWEDAQTRFFAEDGIIETISDPKPRQ
jgi:sulfate/thiosulfate transport system substrate-binding protein